MDGLAAPMGVTLPEKKVSRLRELPICFLGIRDFEESSLPSLGVSDLTLFFPVETVHMWRHAQFDAH